jgi:hypothetical protein
MMIVLMASAELSIRVQMALSALTAYLQGFRGQRQDNLPT